jgi:hypothetical protein
MYNKSISFTSLGENVDRSVKGPKGANVFRISGALTHLVSSIKPESAKEAQIYVVGAGGTEEAKHRIWKAQGSGGNASYASKMSISVENRLMRLMYKYNPYARVYKLAQQVLEEAGAHTLALQGVLKPGSNPKRYNEPTLDKVAVVVQGKGEPLANRQIELHWTKSLKGNLELITDSHSSYFPLRYPIFFPMGPSSGTTSMRPGQIGVSKSLRFHLRLQIWREVILMAPHLKTAFDDSPWPSSLFVRVVRVLIVQAGALQSHFGLVVPSAGIYC